MSVVIVEGSRAGASVVAALLARLEVERVSIIPDPDDALHRIGQELPDLVVLCHRPPAIDGYAWLERLRANPNLADLAVIFLAESDDRKMRIRAFEAGATDVMAKPLEPAEFRARSRNLLKLAQARATLREQTASLRTDFAQAERDLAAREEEIVFRLARAAELRDAETGDHVVRMATYVLLIADALGLDYRTCRNLYLAAPMHDVGKIAVPDSILLKEGPLTEEERLAVQEHVRNGQLILASSSSDLIRLAAEIALTHHERWDGTGYPNGLAGTAIPLAGRIAAVADVFDALTSQRPYKAAWTFEQAREYLLRQRGSQFDPACVDALLQRWDSVLQLSGPSNDPSLAA